jgi:hypothetical protein
MTGRFAAIATTPPPSGASKDGAGADAPEAGLDLARAFPGASHPWPPASRSRPYLTRSELLVDSGQRREQTGCRLAAACNGEGGTEDVPDLDSLADIAVDEVGRLVQHRHGVLDPRPPPGTRRRWRRSVRSSTMPHSRRRGRKAGSSTSKKRSRSRSRPRAGSFRRVSEMTFSLVDLGGLLLRAQQISCVHDNRRQVSCANNRSADAFHRSLSATRSA